MKKILILVISILLLAGCTVKSDITVNYDETVKEDVYILNYNAVFSDDTAFKSIIDNKIKDYEKVLNFKNYKYDYYEGKSLSGAKIYKKYDNICSFFGNSAFNQYVYKYMKCTETDDYIEISNATKQIPYCSECLDWPELNNIEFKIKLPISAMEQNADEIKGTTYIWKYNEKTNDKNFYLKISKSALNEKKIEYLNEQARKKDINRNITIIVLTGVVLLATVIGFTFYKKYKKNSFDN